MLAAVLRRQRVHLLTEPRSLSDASAAAAGAPVVVALLVKAAELHVRADLADQRLPVEVALVQRPGLVRAGVGVGADLTAHVHEQDLLPSTVTEVMSPSHRSSRLIVSRHCAAWAG